MVDEVKSGYSLSVATRCTSMLSRKRLKGLASHAPVSTQSYTSLKLVNRVVGLDAAYKEKEEGIREACLRPPTENLLSEIGTT